MKRKQKIALLSVAAIPAMITMVPDVDVQAATEQPIPEVSGSWVNPQHVFDAKPQRQTFSLGAPTATTTTIETAKGVAELETILKGKFQKYEESFNVKYTGETAKLQEDLNAIYDRFDLDPDNAIYKAATISRDYTYSGYVNNVTINFTIKYNTNFNTEETLKTRVERIIKNELITENMTDFQKIKAIHDYVVTYATFTKDTTGSPHAAYTLLMEKKGLSQAYALLTYYLLNEAGIKAYYMTGTYAGTPHAWNVVEYKGKHYYLDTALDEPSIRDTSITDGKAISYEYFLRGMGGFSTHTVLSTLPSGVIVETTSHESYAKLQNVFNPIPENSWLYYVRTDGVLARLSLKPLPTIGESADKFEEFTFKGSNSNDVEAAYLVHDNGWLYFSNVTDKNYLYKVNTDGTDLTLLVPTYVRDLVITGTTLKYKKADGTEANIPIAVDEEAVAKVIKMYHDYSKGNELKKLINTYLEFKKLTPSQKAAVEYYIGTELNDAIDELQIDKKDDPEGVALRIALLDSASMNFTKEVNDIRKLYKDFTDEKKDIVFNYDPDFILLQDIAADNATVAGKVGTLFGNLSPNTADYYTNIKTALDAYYSLTGAQQGIFLVTHQTALNNALLALQAAETKIAAGNYVYKISQLNPKSPNFADILSDLKINIDKLTDAEQTLISNIDIYKAALKTLDNYTTTVKNLYTAIEKISSDTTKEALEALLARYTALSAAEREMIDKLKINSVKPIDHLKAAIAAKFAETNNVGTVISIINNLDASKESFVPDVENAVIATESFDAAGTQIDPADQTNYDSAKEKLAIAVALVDEIKKIITDIDSIPTTAPTDEAVYKALVEKIEGSIDDLEGLTEIDVNGNPERIPTNLKMNDHVKKHFSDVQKQKLEEAKETIVNSNKLKIDIAAISLDAPITDNATAEDIRKRYTDLSEVGKHFVGDIKKLTDLEALHYKSAAQTVIDLITKIDITKDSFVGDVRKATEAYDNLSPQAKTIVDNGGHNVTLKNAQEKVKPLQAVVDAIDAVSEDDPTKYEGLYKAAQALFDALDDDQERFITNKDDLALFKANIDAAKAVIAAIDALSKDSTEEAIEAVKAKYDDLKEFPKKLVTNYSKLESLIDKANGKEEAEAVIKMIDKLDETKKTFAVDVKKAREAYDKLSPKQKEYVSNYQALLDAEKLVADLAGTSDIAQKLIAQIAAINNTSASFKTDVEAAKSAYAALSEEQQALINNYNVLKEHLATYDTYAAQAKKLEDKINALSNTSPGYQSALAALQSEYNAFNAAQKAFVAEYAVKLLNDAQSGIDAVRNVTNMILALNPSRITFHADVANARAAYNALIKNHGVYLAAYLEEALEKAEALVEKDKTAARKVVNAINSLSSDSILKEIERARRVYNNLTALQRPLVTNLQTLIDFETGKLSYNTSGIPDGVDTDDTNTDTEEINPLPDFAAVPGERTAMTKSSKGDTYTAKIFVSNEVGNSERFVLTTRANVTAIIPPTVTVVGDKTGTMAIEIQATSSRVSFKATMDKKPVTFATEVDIILESVPKNSVVLRVDQYGNRVPATYTVDGDQYTIKTKGSDTFIITRSTTTFTDIQNDSHREYIEELAARNIIQNDGNGRFNPNQNITRAEFAVMMARALDIQPSTDTNFNDVRGKSYENEVQALYEVGIIQGVNATTFNPNSTLTRQQAAMMVERMLDYVNVDTNVWESPQFTDSHLIADSAINAVALMQSLDIVSGKPNGSFDPLGKLTRSQLAKILYKALQSAEML
ncbi:S-layer homology domain-containing protein [Lysinibacillus sp. NPDC096418]|uniref:S-layer homology domain-containing protein n=1 Tax=Lysinibacillus sp. NPDC096418 TaxID=3364138 RepID=UPI0038139AA3